MHALHSRVCSQPARSTTAAAPSTVVTHLKRCCCVQSIKRRDVLTGTVGLFSAADALASETEPAQQQAAAVTAAADGAAQPPAAAAGGAAKTRKKRKRPVARPKNKAALKPPGTVPRVKLADNLTVSKVCALSSLCSCLQWQVQHTLVCCCRRWRTGDQGMLAT